MARFARIVRGSLVAAAFSALSCGGSRDGRHVSLVVDSASGVKQGTPVEVAGVPVGEVEGVRLEGWRARVLLRVDRAVDLRSGCAVRIDARGLLGDKMLTIVEGGGELVPEHGELRGDASHELEMMARLAQTVARVDAMATDMEAVTKAVHAAVDKDGVAGLRPMICDGAAKR
jgi:phospholipid/cholesterol/gamma-HCH transport system substrate-binding protein